MSVSSTARKQTFAGGTSTLTFTFRALTSTPTDIKVKKTLISTGVDSSLTYTTDYTVAVSADGVGGVVTVSPSISTLYNLTVYRETTNKQESDYDDYNQFPANTLETDLDRRTLVDQEQSEDLDRTIKLPITNTLTGLTLPNPVDGKTLKWSISSGTVTMVNSTVDIDTAIAAALASQTAAATSATTALAAQTASEAARDISTAAATTATTAANTSKAAATTATNVLIDAEFVLVSDDLALGVAGSIGTVAVSMATIVASISHATTALTAATSALNSANLASTSATTAVNTVQVAINLQTANYTLALTDVNKMVDMNSSGTISLIIPSSGTVNFVTGSVIALRQLGAGKVLVTTAAGVTLNKEVGATTTGQYAIAAVLKTAADTWHVFGALEA